jgi:hypothetical protein
MAVRRAIREKIAETQANGRDNFAHAATRKTVNERSSIIGFLDGKRRMAVVVGRTPGDPAPRAGLFHPIQARKKSVGWAFHGKIAGVIYWNLHCRRGTRTRRGFFCVRHISPPGFLDQGADVLSAPDSRARPEFCGFGEATRLDAGPPRGRADRDYGGNAGFSVADDLFQAQKTDFRQNVLHIRLQWNAILFDRDG